MVKTRWRKCSKENVNVLKRIFYEVNILDEGHFNDLRN